MDGGLRRCILSSDLVGGFLQLLSVGTKTRAQTSQRIGRPQHHWVANLLGGFQGIGHLTDEKGNFALRDA